MATDNIQIVREILKQTRSKDLEWHPTNIRNQYSVRIGIGEVVVDYNDEVDDKYGTLPTFRISFLNIRGEAVDKIEVQDSADSHYGLFYNLWNAILESYFQKNETMTSIRAALGIIE